LATPEKSLSPHLLMNNTSGQKILYCLYNNKNNLSLVVGDYFTKWMEAIPILDAEAKTVADKFVLFNICEY
jgi:hypothetical protein